MGVGTQRDAEGACEAKVGQLQVALAVDEQVLRLEVAVQHAAAVAVADAFAQLFHKLLDDGGAEPEVLQRLARVFRQGDAAAAVGHGQ